MSPVEALNWRYAVKQFSSETLDTGLLDQLLEAVRLSPSAFGLQPYRLLLISDPEVRARLLPYSMGQDKVLNSSHLLVFAALEQVDESMITEHIDLLQNSRGGESSDYEGFSAHLKAYLNGMTEQEKRSWADQQLFIALGNCLTSAALLGIDSCPMTGFEPDGYDQVLGLKGEGLRTVAICALGQRDGTDATSAHTKVRLPPSLFTRVVA